MREGTQKVIKYDSLVHCSVLASFGIIVLLTGCGGGGGGGAHMKAIYIYYQTSKCVILFFHHEYHCVTWNRHKRTTKDPAGIHIRAIGQENTSAKEVDIWLCLRVEYMH